MDYLKLTVDKLLVEEITDLVVDDSCGAVSLFVGTTRDNFEGKKVLRLEYEAYEPMALKAMKSICEEIREKWPAVHGIAIYHRLGNVPCREASVIIAISSPHRSDSLQAVSQCIDRLKGSVPIWKKEVYATQDGVWKENAECSPEKKIKREEPVEETPIDEDQVQINVSNEELQQRIQNFMDRKREQVNMNNIHDFIPFRGSETEEETCARVRAQYVRRNYSKGHLTVRKVNNEWGPQTIKTPVVHHDPVDSGLPSSIAERVLNIERFLNIGPVSKDVYKRLKDMEDRIAYLQAISPEYAQFWRNQNHDVKKEKLEDYTFSADDIARKIEQLEKSTTNF